MTPPSELLTALQATAYRLILPEVALLGVACVLFVAGLFAPGRRTAFAGGLVGLGLAAVLAALPSVGGQELVRFGDQPAGAMVMVNPDVVIESARSLAPFDPSGAAGFVRWLALLTAGIVLLAAWPELLDGTATEYVGCVLVVAAGTSLCGRANDLISLFLSLELLSIPTYVLLMMAGRGKPGQESAVKYFLLSVLSSAVLLFGFSYLYGLAGSTNLGAVVATLTNAHAAGGVNPLAVVAVVLVVAGLGFRVTAVPFHFYAPDVYQGGPTGVVTLLATAPKVAGFVALARVLGLLPATAAVPFDATHTLIPLALWTLAVATMTLGNLLALLQTDLRRLLAYSGVAHGGYMLIGLVTASAGSAPGGLPTGPDAVLVYLVAYVLMTAGAFAVLLHLGEGARSTDDLAGLGGTHPLAAGLLAVALVSLIGLPLTAGFVGKFLLFVAAFNAPTTTPMGGLFKLLAVVAAVNAAIGAVYYLRLIGVMYLRTALHPLPARRFGLALLAALVCAVGTVALGVYPKPLADAARRAVSVVR